MNKFKDTNELRVFRDKTYAGLLRRTANGCEFKFDKSFLENEAYSGISFFMRKSTKLLSHNGDNLPPFFAGLLPEGVRLNAVLKSLKTSKDDLFSILAAVGNQVIGDVYIESTAELEINAPKLKEINFQEYFQKIISGNDIVKDDEPIPKQFLTTADKRLQKENRSNSTIFFPI